MSRARPIRLPDGSVLTYPDGTEAWFDTTRNSEKATHDQLELLAAVEDLDLDDLLDEVLTQDEVVTRLRKALGTDPIPYDVVERRERLREYRQVQPECRQCGRKGDSTRHHFVNKWILKELAHYSQKWADRSKNTIPMCIDCHRDLHDRGNGPQSIVGLLDDEEREFVERALSALSEERPKLLILIARGDDSVYEARLAKDWIEGRFSVEETPPKLALVR